MIVGWKQTKKLTHGIKWRTSQVGIGGTLSYWTSLVAQMVKRLSTMWETWVRSLGWEDSLEKEMATHASILAWKIPWAEEPGRLQSMGLLRVRHDWVTEHVREHTHTNTHTHTHTKWRARNRVIYIWKLFQNRSGIADHWEKNE